MFSVVKRYSNGRISFNENPKESISAYCASKRADIFFKCDEYYKELFNDNCSSVGFRCCPHGLVTTTAIGCGENTRVLSGFWIEGIGSDKLSQAVIRDAKVSELNIQRTLELIGDVLDETRDYDSVILEAAIHDVRHINSSITINAEKLLSDNGFKPNETWDFTELYSDASKQRMLTIFIASRDLSTALSMHEVARDPASAERDSQQTHIHKIFQAQKHISYDRLRNKNINLVIGSTNKYMPLTRSFRLIPKILIDNAIKYASRNSEINIRFSDSGNFFRIECINEGPVVGEHEVEAVFQRKYRGQNRSGIEGHGLGLWLARAIVDVNNGSIKMEIDQRRRDMSGQRLGITRIVVTIAQ